MVLVIRHPHPHRKVITAEPEARMRQLILQEVAVVVLAQLEAMAHLLAVVLVETALPRQLQDLR